MASEIETGFETGVEIIIEIVLGIVTTIFYCLLIYLIFLFIKDEIVMPPNWVFYSIVGGYTFFFMLLCLCNGFKSDWTIGVWWYVLFGFISFCFGILYYIGYLQKIFIIFTSNSKDDKEVIDFVKPITSHFSDNENKFVFSISNYTKSLMNIIKDY
jgi:hypothetical protein